MSQSEPPEPVSYYHHFIGSSHHNRRRQSLLKTIKADICIIGGGFSGISSALHLGKAGFKTVVLERHQLGWGASGRNGGQVATTPRMGVAEMEKKFGEDIAKKLFNLNQQAAALVKGIITENNIECDYQPGIYYTACKKRHFTAMLAETDYLNRHYDCHHLKKLDAKTICRHIATKAYHGAIYDSKAAHLNPLEYLLGMAEAAENNSAEIYENTKVEKWYQGNNQGNQSNQSNQLHLETPAGEVICSYVIFCCNAYLGKLLPQAASYILPINNYIIASDILPRELAGGLIRNKAAVCSSNFVVDYYRISASGRLLFGGGESYRERLPCAAKIKEIVRLRMLKVFEQLADIKIEYGWGGKLAITLTRLPSFGTIDDRIYFMQGYSGNGIAMATMAGKIIADRFKGCRQTFDLMVRTSAPPLYGGYYLRRFFAIAGVGIAALRDRF